MRNAIQRRAAMPIALAAALAGGCPLAPPPADGPRQVLLTTAPDSQAAAIVREQDDRLIVASAFRGLRIFDLGDPGQPLLRGGVPVSGRAVELLLHGEVAYVFTVADLAPCAAEPTDALRDEFGPVARPDYRGARLWTIHVADPDRPQLLATLDLGSGYVSARRAGDRLHIAGHALHAARDDDGDGAPDPAADRPELDPNELQLTAIDVAEPARPRIVATQRLRGRGITTRQSATAIYALAAGPGPVPQTAVTRVATAEAGDPMRVDATLLVTGGLPGPDFCSEFEGMLRIVTQTPAPGGALALYTVFDAREPARMTRVASGPLGLSSGLNAIAFDGPAAYACAAGPQSPLFVIDLSNPLEPTVHAGLRVPGTQTVLMPRGEQLIAAGLDPQAAGVQSVVTLFDVAQRAAPRRIAETRLPFGPYGPPNALPDVMRAGLAGSELVLLSASVETVSQIPISFIQLVRVTESDLAEAGQTDLHGTPRAAGVLGDDQPWWFLTDLELRGGTSAGAGPSAGVGPTAPGVLTLLEDQELVDAGLAECSRRDGFKPR